MILDILFNPSRDSIFWAWFYKISDPRGQIVRGCWIFPSTVRENAVVAYAPPSPSSTETSVAIWTNSTRRMGGARVPAIKSSSFVSGPALRELRYCQGSYCREVVGYLIPEWMRFTKPHRQHRTLDMCLTGRALWLIPWPKFVLHRFLDACDRRSDVLLKCYTIHLKASFCKDGDNNCCVSLILPMVLAESESASVKLPGWMDRGCFSSLTVPGRLRLWPMQRQITCQSSGTDNYAEVRKNFQQAGGCVGATIN
jgi:hypothetical protein